MLRFLPRVQPAEFSLDNIPSRRPFVVLFHFADVFFPGHIKSFLSVGFPSWDRLTRGTDRLLGTDQPAQVTSHALSAVQYRSAGLAVKGDRLMSSIHARDIAPAAANAAIVMEYREQNSIPFNVMMFDNGMC